MLKLFWENVTEKIMGKKLEEGLPMKTEDPS